MKPKYYSTRTRSSNALVSLITTVTVCFGATSTAFAAWEGLISSDWNVGGNWNPAGVPNATAAVVNITPANIATITSAVPNVSSLSIGSGGSTNGTVNIGPLGVITSTGNVIAGEGNTGTGVLNLTGGTLTTTGEFWAGQQVGSTGTVNLGSGTINVANWVAIGRQGGNGTLNVSGGTFNKTDGGQFIVGDGSIGKMKIEGGTVNVNSEVWIGQGSATATGLLEQSAGTLNVGNWFVVGRGGGTGTYNLSGGTITHTGNSFIVGGNGAGDKGTMTQTGGFVNANGGATWIAENGTGTLNLNGGEFTANVFQLAVNGGAVGNAFINTGSTLRARQISGGGGTENLHFDGGQVIARENRADFIGGAFNANTVKIDAGGFKIDSNGFNLATGQEMGGVGAITKTGLGTFRINGVQSFTGGIAVNAGKIIRGSDAGTLAGSVTVAAGAGFGAAVSTNVDQAKITNLSLASGTTLDIDLGNTLGNPTVAALDVAGTLALAGPVTVNVADQLYAVGSVKLVRFVKASATGVSLANLVLGSIPPGINVDPVTPFTIDLSDPTYGFINLNVTYASQVRWEGDVSSQWNFAAANWYELTTDPDPINPPVGTPSSLFTNGASVLFNDDLALASSSDVVLATGVDVKPDLVTFNNAARDYTLTGAGKISDGAGLSTNLVKQGAGSLTIATPNTYTGVTTLAGGVTTVATVENAGAASPLGAATAAPANLVLSGGTLAYTGPADVIDRGFTIAANNSTLSIVNDLEITGGVASTGGNFIKLGAGNLKITNNSPNVIGLVNQGARVSAGTLTFKGAGAQTNAVAGEMWISHTPDVAANLVLDTTSLTTTNFLAIGRGNGTSGTICNMTVTGSTLNTVNFSAGFDNGVVGNTATQNINVTNSTWVNNGVVYLAESGGSTTVATFDNVIYNGNNAVTLARNGATSNAALTLKNGTVMTKTTAPTNIGENGIAALTIQDTSSYISNAGDFFIGVNNSASGTVTVSGTATLSVLGGNDLRVGSTGKGVVTQSGGTINAANWAVIGRFANTDAGVVSELNISGGTFNQTTANRAILIGEQGKGIVNLTGTGAINAAGNIVVSNGPTGVGTLNINAGTSVATQSITEGTANGGGGSSSVYFNGGQLTVQTAATAPVFLGGLDVAQVKVGGFLLNTNGNDVVINQALTNDGTAGNYLKTGAGRVFQNGNVDLNGNATISTGGLSGTGQFFCPVNISSGANVNPGTVGGQGLLLASSFQFASGSSLTVDLSNADPDLESLFAGDITLNGTVTLNVTGAITGPVYVIANYGTQSGTFTLGAVPAGYTVNYNYNNLNQIALVQTATPYSTWAAANITAIQPAADATPGGNPDNDGLTNSAEFALNGNPLSGASSGKVVSKIANVAGVPSLVLSLPVRTGATFSGSPATTSALIDGLTYKIEGSAALAAWTLPVSEVLGADKTAVETGLPAVDSGWTYRSFTTGPVSANPKAFLRSVIGQP
ncbi:MAG: hypothetical protein V4640_13435 [Verrucomicrobiota bacterium]